MTWPPSTHQDVQDAVTALQNAMPNGTPFVNYRPRVGDYVTWPWTNNSQTALPVDGHMPLVPYFLPQGTYDAIVFSISAAGSAGSLVVAGAYADVSTGAQNTQIGTLLGQTGQIDTTTTGTKIGVLSTPIVVPAEGTQVWAGVVAQGGASTRPNMQMLGQIFLSYYVTWAGYGPDYYTTNQWVVATGLTSGTLPSPPTTFNGPGLYADGAAKISFRRSA